MVSRQSKVDLAKSRSHPYKFDSPLRAKPFFSFGTQNPEFSNFHCPPGGIKHLKECAPSVEHHYHAIIAMLFLQNALRLDIIPEQSSETYNQNDFCSPQKAKNLGRNTKSVVSDNEMSKLVPILPFIMRAILIQKFSQHANLKDKLLKTGTSQLWECSEHDIFWGSGISPNQFGYLKPIYGAKNLMGICLEEIRELCRTNFTFQPSWETILVGDSQVNRLKAVQNQLKFPFLAWSGGKLDMIFRIALSVIHKGLKKCILFAGTNNLILDDNNNKITRIKPSKMASLFASKIGRVHSFYPDVRFYIFEIPPRFDLPTESHIAKAPQDCNRALHQKFEQNR